MQWQQWGCQPEGEAAVGEVPNDYDKGKEALAEIVKTFRFEDRNEATIRLQVIDDLLRCLGWDLKKDCLPEQSHKNEQSRKQEYADYTLCCPKRSLIVEAKREGDYFELPAGKKRLEYSIGNLCEDYPNLKAAIVQVVGYCHDRGVPYAAVTNGHQVVAFVATRDDGVPPLEGKALVFPTLQFMLDNFVELWQALSKPAIRDDILHRRLIGEETPQPPPKFHMTMHNYPGVKGRNVFQTDLQILSELVIEDVVQSAELEHQFIQECYCQSGVLSQYALTSKEVLKTRYAALFSPQQTGPTVVAAKGKKGISQELLAESLSRRPIMLVGDVGVGKTSFIKYLLNVAAVEEFENAITLYVDLGSQAILTSSVSEAVVALLAKELRNKHQIKIEDNKFVSNVYYVALEEFDKSSIWSSLKGVNDALFVEKRILFLADKLASKQEHLRNCLSYISKNQRKQIVIFIDNVDQRDYDTQQQAFLAAQEIAANWPATVYVTLRPETYNRSLRRGALSGYHPKAFTISPPRIDEVVLRRLTFARKMTSGEIPIPTLGTDMRFGTLDLIIRSFIETMERRNEIPECLDNVSGGNVRVALDYVRDFFGSGHVDTQKIVDKCRENGHYTVSLHEFIRAILYQDAIHYDPNQSPITNIFDITAPDRHEHFLMAFLISLIESQVGYGIEAGFVPLTTLYERLQPMGYTPRQIEAAVSRAVNGKLLEVSGRLPVETNGPLPELLRATSIGIYHIKRLAGMFAYMDGMVADTPICDTDTFNKLTPAEQLLERVERCQVFLHYLDESFRPLAKHTSLYNWHTYSNQVKSEINNRILRRP